MEVVLAKSAGFCFGVQKAVDTVYEQIEKKKGRIYTYGPIIHNEEVVKDLEEKGVLVINSLEELKAVKEGVVVIRSHGATKEIYDIIENNGLELVDATCPFVKKIHNIVREESDKGNFVIIIGSDKHPEVEGIKGWSDKENTVVIESEEQAENFVLDVEKKNKHICIVSQTTFNSNKFKYLVEIICKKGYYINVLDTICNATHMRQNEARKIAREVDAMIVIGGKNSSNTQKLYEISKSECNNTYYIQTVKDLDRAKLGQFEYIGITAGASTPKKIIEEVQTNVRKFWTVIRRRRNERY